MASCDQQAVTHIPPFPLTVGEALDLGQSRPARTPGRPRLPSAVPLCSQVGQSHIKWTPEAVSAEDRKHWNEDAGRASIAAEWR